MSSLYALEPQPTAKVLLQTTSGEILLELFAKQTPLTSRNFLQLCLDGYYDGTIFHRLVPGFVIQGGDPTGTGEGGEAIYDGGLIADEFHSRLKFNRRGLLGMANGGKKDDNGSQFFLTLDKTEELQGRNTMFGRVVGDTIYNMVKMAEAELPDHGSERPLYPTKITASEVLVNPFDDMVRRERTVKPVVQESRDGKAKPKKKKGGKVLLSFGGDEGDEPDIVPVAKKAKYNTKLVQGVDEPASKPSNAAVALKPSVPRPAQHRASPSPPPPPPPPVVALPTRPSKASSMPSPPPTSALDRANMQIAELKASMKRHVTPAPTTSSTRKTALEQLIPASSIRGRKRKLGGAGGAKDTSDKEALSILSAFRAKLEKASTTPGMPDIRSHDTGDASEAAPKPVTKDARHKDEDADDDEEARLCDLHFIADCHSCASWAANGASEAKNGDGDGDDGDGNVINGNVDDGNGHDNDNDNDTGWLSHSLSFAKDRLGKDLTWRKKTEEELVVIDPREQEEAILGKHRKKKGGRKGVGGGSTAWDRDRERERDAGRARGRG